VTVSPSSDPARAGRSDMRFWVTDIVNSERAYQDTTFNGKAN